MLTKLTTRIRAILRPPAPATPEPDDTLARYRAESLRLQIHAIRQALITARAELTKYESYLEFYEEKGHTSGFIRETTQFKADFHRKRVETLQAELETLEAEFKAIGPEVWRG